MWLWGREERRIMWSTVCELISLKAKKPKEECIEPKAVDAVPVIRCKDCKWYGRADKRRFYRGMDCLQNRIATIVPDEDYCSRAERKEE